MLLRIFADRSEAKNYCPVNILSVVSKISEEPINDSLVEHLEKYDILPDFKYDFWVLH